MTSVLITGSRGFVGPYLDKHLRDHGFGTRGFDLRDGQDIRNYEQIRVAVEEHDPDYIIHLAAAAYVPETTTDPRRGFDITLGGTLNLLEAVRHCGSRARILLAGTSEEVGYDCDVHSEQTVPRPTTPYGVAKLAAGQLGMTYARAYGIHVVVTRAFNHTGPRHAPIYAVPSFAKRVAEVEVGKSKVVRHGNLSSRRCYTDVRDMVRAYRMAMDLPSGIYNVCSDAVFSMNEILTQLCDMAKTEIVTELDDALNRPSSDKFPKPDSSKFRDLTGWEPEITFAQTLKDTLDYWREHV